jgi:hypothetical protein
MEMKLSKDKRERLIADRFLRHLGSNWRILPGHRDRPDFLLSDEFSTIALELTEYRQPGANDRSVNYDRDFKREMADASIDDCTVNHWGVSFTYRLTEGRETNRAYTVPRPKDRDSAVKEFKQLVLSIPPAQHQHPIEVRFRGDHPRLANSRLGSRYHWVNEKDFPVLHKHFESIGLTYSPGCVQGLPRSNLGTGWVGVLEDELRKHVQRKLSRLADYRQSVPPGTKIHLLIWNSGGSVTQRFARRHIGQVRRIVVEEQGLGGDQFDVVWWGFDLLVNHRDGTKHEFVKLA